MDVKGLEKIEKMSRELIGLLKLKESKKEMVVNNPINPGNPFEVVISKEDFKVLDKRIDKKTKELVKIVEAL